VLFKKIIGQKPVKEKLLNMLQDGRVPHALMFTGSRGKRESSGGFCFCSIFILFKTSKHMIHVVFARHV
jgi:hypothetical protein